MEFTNQLIKILMGAGLAREVYQVSLLTSGGNNKTWRVDSDSGSFLAKRYFRHTEDLRDRLTAEFEFARYAQSCAPDAVAKAVYTEPSTGFSFFEFLNGNPILVGEVGEKEIYSAANFFAALNKKEMRIDATHLQFASEACFSIIEHLSLVRNRIDILSKSVNQEQIEDRTDIFSFVIKLSNYWQKLESYVVDQSKLENISIDSPLPQEDRCLSPSDFGFHNSLRSKSESIRFFDFEYAGWDDTAKMIGDFFAQLAVPVPEKYFDTFVDIALSNFTNKQELIRRAKLLRPVYQAKWCCIALNVFLPVNLARRKFAKPDLDEVALKVLQLRKAKSLFHLMESNNYVLH
jgi:hypothetical protein